MEFRLNGEHWHFSRNCPMWPTDSFDVINLDKQLPISFKVCPDCTVLSPIVRFPKSSAQLSNFLKLGSKPKSLGFFIASTIETCLRLVMPELLDLV